MSSFICSAKHFNSVESATKQLAYSSNFRFGYAFKEKFAGLYHKQTQDQTDATIENIFDNLRYLNAVCVSLQYKHHYEGKLDAEIKQQTEHLLHNKKTQVVFLNKVGLYKNLSCLLYQIEKEHLAELRELTEQENNALLFVRLLCDQIAHEFISDSAEYDKASWGID